MQYYWTGSRTAKLDTPTVTRLQSVSLGCYGGNTTAGARKNEDGAIVWTGPDWVMSVVLDGHGGSESVEAVLELFAEAEPSLRQRCDEAKPQDFLSLQRDFIALLTNESAIERMSKVRGETACLLAYQRGAHMLWLSIGDNTLYVLHPELAELGQFTVTTRNFYEWIGERSSVSTLPPCFSTGIRQLRQGQNAIILATDGIQEFSGRPFESPRAFANAVQANPLGESFQNMLTRAHEAAAVDSCTLVGWSTDNPHRPLMPSA